LIEDNWEELPLEPEDQRKKRLISVLMEISTSNRLKISRLKKTDGGEKKAITVM
jgi:hypothetical protein